jgi:hypothetical protein
MRLFFAGLVGFYLIKIPNNLFLSLSKHEIKQKKIMASFGTCTKINLNIYLYANATKIQSKYQINFKKLFRIFEFE